jgi:hypothetical protein
MCCCQAQQILLVSSIYATCFGYIDHPHAFKYMTLKFKLHIYVYYTVELGYNVMKGTEYFVSL